jgi:GTPase SAR1 family protein
MLGNPIILKSLVLGGPKVGKTQLINQFVHN